METSTEARLVLNPSMHSVLRSIHHRCHFLECSCCLVYEVTIGDVILLHALLWLIFQSLPLACLPRRQTGPLYHLPSSLPPLLLFEAPKKDLRAPPQGLYRSLKRQVVACLTLVTRLVRCPQSQGSDRKLSQSLTSSSPYPLDLQNVPCVASQITSLKQSIWSTFALQQHQKWNLGPLTQDLTRKGNGPFSIEYSSWRGKHIWGSPRTGVETQAIVQFRCTDRIPRLNQAKWTRTQLQIRPYHRTNYSPTHLVSWVCI